MTTTVVNYGKTFACGEAYYLILLNSLKYVLREHHATLIAYVLMPSHIHAILELPEGEDISDLMRDFKKFTSTKIRQQLERDGQEYWLKRLRWNARTKNNQRFKLWMDRFDDFVIDSQSVLEAKIDYIHENPVKANLVVNPEDWQFSSARNYILNDNSLVDIPIDWVL